LTHFVQRCAGKATATRSAYRLAHDIEDNGTQFDAVNGREMLSFSAHTLSGSANSTFQVLSDMVLNPRLQPHEVDEARAMVAEDVLNQQEDDKACVMEGLHAAAFRTTLGLPLLCPSYNSGRISNEAVRFYMAEQFVAPRLVITGTNMDHEKLVALATESFGNLTDKAPSHAAARYFGGDKHDFTAEPDHDGVPRAHVAVGFSGASCKDSQWAALEVLRAVLGGTTVSYKARIGSASRLARLSSEKGLHSACAFNKSYSDAGLFGVYVRASSANADSAVKAAVVELRNASRDVTEEEVARARNIVKVSWLSCDAVSNQSQCLASDIFLNGRPTSTADAIAAIGKVSAQDVKNAAAQLLRSNPSVSSRGDLGEFTLYSDDIANLVRS
jgi:predicted Zn-dependent peptidase